MTSSDVIAAESSRSCGECTACCEGWLSAENLDMRPGKACGQLTARGCGAYETRPDEPCRRFFCVWLRLPSFPEELRPDRCGAIVIPTYASAEGDDTKRMLSAVPLGNPMSEDAKRLLIRCAALMELPLVIQEFIKSDGEYIGVKGELFDGARGSESRLIPARLVEL